MTANDIALLVAGFGIGISLATILWASILELMRKSRNTFAEQADRAIDVADDALRIAKEAQHITDEYRALFRKEAERNQTPFYASSYLQGRRIGSIAERN